MTDDTRRMASIRILTGGRTAEERKGAMPTDDIDALSGPELSAAVAQEVMGWDRTATDGTPLRSDNGEDVFFDPHVDRNEAHRVLKRCIENGKILRVLGMVADHCNELFKESEMDPFSRLESIMLELITIDPAIICRAALRAVRSAK